MRELAVGAGVAVVFPVYRLCPEARYPTALEECYMEARWVARERGEPDIRLQLLFYPVTDAAFDAASYHLPLLWEELVPTLKQMIERKTN